MNADESDSTPREAPVGSVVPPREVLVRALADGARAAMLAGDLAAARVALDALERLQAPADGPRVLDLDVERARRGR